eukprot:384169-Prorocentrum_minimum.AAC.2
MERSPPSAPVHLGQITAAKGTSLPRRGNHCRDGEIAVATGKRPSRRGSRRCDGGVGRWGGACAPGTSAVVRCAPCARRRAGARTRTCARWPPPPPDGCTSRAAPCCTTRRAAPHTGGTLQLARPSVALGHVQKRRKGASWVDWARLKNYDTRDCTTRLQFTGQLRSCSERLWLNRLAM